MPRIHVVGTSGSGKTTVARKIAESLGIKHIELDAINWQEGWSALPKDEFRKRVEKEITDENWTIDGNYSAVRDIIWDKVDTIVWLDTPFLPVFLRVTWRTITRILTKEKLWNNNIEGLDALVGKYGMPGWVIKTHEKRREEYPSLLASPELENVEVKIFKSLKDANDWITTLK